MDKNITLANKFRPKTLSDVIGQEYLTDKYKVLSSMVFKNKPFNLLLFGPTSSGKTSIAYALINDLKREPIMFNAAIGDKKELVEDVEKCLNENEKYILIIDECHRLNKNIIEYLLPYLEENEITIFMLTTENVYFAIPPAIRSRCFTAELKPLTSVSIYKSLKKSCSKNNLNFNDTLLKAVSEKCDGDIRSGINMLEFFINLYEDLNKVTIKELNESFPNGIMTTESGDSNYYDILSALHKSCRGSDINAALYWASKAMLTNDLKSLSRRLICIANEDIGLANENLVTQVMIGAKTALKLGMPEARLIYSNLIIQICLSDKSNSTLAIDETLNTIKEGNNFNPPPHLRDSHSASANKRGHGVDYKYPHIFLNHYVDQQYLPNELKGANFFSPDLSIKAEKELVEKWKKRINGK